MKKALVVFVFKAEEFFEHFVSFYLKVRFKK